VLFVKDCFHAVKRYVQFLHTNIHLRSEKYISTNQVRHQDQPYFVLFWRKRVIILLGFYFNLVL